MPSTQNTDNLARSSAGFDPAERDVAEAVRTLSPDAKKDIASVTIQALAPAAKEDIAAQTVQTLPPEAKKDIAAEAVQTLPPDAKKDVASAAMQTLTSAARKDVVAEAVESLSFEDQKKIAGLLPSQPVADRIWQMVVGTFALVFILSAIALFVAAFWRTEQIQLLLTVVTTVAGILAGFISGRSSVSGDSGR